MSGSDAGTTDDKHTEVMGGTRKQILTESQRDLFAMGINLSVWQRRRLRVKLFPFFHALNHTPSSLQGFLRLRSSDVMATETKETEDADSVLRCASDFFHKTSVFVVGSYVGPASAIALLWMRY